MNISVAMCTYNGSRFLKEQLLSISSQSKQPFELVICDDGSTDATEQIVQEFHGSVTFRVSFHKNPTNLGSTKNFEQAIKLCKGDAIALCDQDDRWRPEKLAMIDAILEAEPEVAGVFSNATLIDQDGQLIEGDLWQRAGFTPQRLGSFNKREAPYQLTRRDTVTGATFVFRSQYMNHLIPISTEWVHDGWIALILASIAEIRPMPECVMSYRLHAEQQVGAQEVAWHTHLSTRKELALAFHSKVAQRFSQMAQRLAVLSADPGITSYLRRKVRFQEGRAAALKLPLGKRIIPITRMLRDYSEFEKGLMSYLRDLLH